MAFWPSHTRPFPLHHVLDFIISFSSKNPEILKTTNYLDRSNRHFRWLCCDFSFQMNCVWLDWVSTACSSFSEHLNSQTNRILLIYPSVSLRTDTEHHRVREEFDHHLPTAHRVPHPVHEKLIKQLQDITALRHAAWFICFIQSADHLVSIFIASLLFPVKTVGWNFHSSSPI